MDSIIGEAEHSALVQFLDIVGSDIISYLQSISYSELQASAHLVLKAFSKGNRLHVSGIGKPGHLAGYASSLLSSTGTPAVFLHGTEAIHGSCGQTLPGDVVIFISNSGETKEMRMTVQALKSNGCYIIGISGDPKSWLAIESDAHIYAGTPNEGGPLNRAPRMSILVECVAIQALSVILQEHAKITPQQYIKWHPAGKLGLLREDEQ